MSPLSAFVRLVVMTAVSGLLLFLAAGTLDWPAGWAYLAATLTITGTYTAVVLWRHPDLLEERRRPPADAKQWDKPLAAIVGLVGPLALILLSGLDRRWHWSPPMPWWLPLAGLALGVAGGMLANWAVAANRYFSALVRIQRDRGHRVVVSGPYGFVRHPGYTGTIVYMLGMAVALGSHAAIIATAAISLVLVVRTVLEDRTLKAELAGYRCYASRVPYRLIPGVW